MICTVPPTWLPEFPTHAPTAVIGVLVLIVVLEYYRNKGTGALPKMISVHVCEYGWLDCLRNAEFFVQPFHPGCTPATSRRRRRSGSGSGSGV